MHLQDYLSDLDRWVERKNAADHGAVKSCDIKDSMQPPAKPRERLSGMDYEAWSRFDEADQTEPAAHLEWYRQEGNKMYRMGKVHEALDIYYKALSFASKRERKNLLCNLCACHLSLGNYSECIKFADRTLVLEPGNAKACYRKCKALLCQNRLDEARDTISVAVANGLQMNPDLDRISCRIDELCRNSSNSGSPVIDRCSSLVSFEHIAENIGDESIEIPVEEITDMNWNIETEIRRSCDKTLGITTATDGSLDEEKATVFDDPIDNLALPAQTPQFSEIRTEGVEKQGSNVDFVTGFEAGGPPQATGCLVQQPLLKNCIELKCLMRSSAGLSPEQLYDLLDNIPTEHYTQFIGDELDEDLFSLFAKYFIFRGPTQITAEKMVQFFKLPRIELAVMFNNPEITSDIVQLLQSMDIPRMLKEADLCKIQSLLNCN